MTAIPSETANLVATGAPGTVTVGDAVYVVTQPTKQDFVALMKRLQALWDQASASIIADTAAKVVGLPPATQQMAIEAAVRLAGKAAKPDDNALSMLTLEPAGCAFFLYLLTRKHHPNVTLKDIAAGITDENVEAVAVQITEASDLKKVGPKN